MDPTEMSLRNTLTDNGMAALTRNKKGKKSSIDQKRMETAGQ